MKRIVFAIVLAAATLAMFGCGGGSSPPPTFVTQIVSDQGFDGDITKSPPPAVFTIVQNAQSLFAGIHPTTQDESRAFLDFPLTGAGGVPGSAAIVSATLDLFINSYQSTVSTIPMRIELVTFASVLLVADYDSTPLTTATVTFPVFRTDSGQHVAVDVTTLMAEAQRLGLLNFQVRILEDFGPVTPGLIEINDTTGPNRGALAPLWRLPTPDPVLGPVHPWGSARPC